jgi:UDP-glucose 4-epimerase
MFVEMDICDREGLELYSKTINKVHCIYHLAAQINLRHSIEDPAKDAHINIIGSLNVIEMAKCHNATIMFASTGGALYSPKSKCPWDTFAKIEPKSPYGLAKYTVERYLRISDVRYMALRLSNVYGPRQSHKGEAGVIAIFINNVLNNEDLTIFGDGRQTRDFIYVDDVVDAFDFGRQLHEHIFQSSYNISTCIGTDINTIADMIVSKMWANRNIIHKPAIPGELKKSVLRYGLQTWKPQVSLDDGISRTIKYFSDI